MDYSLLIGIHDRSIEIMRESMREEGSRKLVGKPFKKIQALVMGRKPTFESGRENSMMESIEIKGDSSPQERSVSVSMSESFMASSLRIGKKAEDSLSLKPHEVSELMGQSSSSRKSMEEIGDEEEIPERERGIASPDGNEIVFLGVIDMLQTFTWKKSAESMLKGITEDKHKLSAVPPYEYSNRFCKFLSGIIQERREPKL